MPTANHDDPRCRPGRRFSRAYITLVLAGLALVLPCMAWGVVGALRSNTNDPRQWLPRGFAETDTYHWLQQHFGNDEITVVSWPGCTLGDPRVEQLARAIERDSETGFYERAITGRRIFDQLTSEPLSLSAQDAISRLQGVLIGPDRKTTCLILTISESGIEDRASAVQYLRDLAESECSIEPDQLRLGGPTVDAATIDVESQRLLLELAALSGVIALVATWLRLRSMRLALIVLVTSVYSTGLSLAVLYYTGGSMNLVMTMLPPLVYVLSVSAAVHLVNYYRDAVDEGYTEDAPRRALAMGWRPCTLASATTAIGLLSLAVSEIVPVKMFGVYSAAGMLASLIVVVTLLPVALTLWPMRPRASETPHEHTPHRTSRIDRLANLVNRRHTWVTAACLLLMISAGCGLPRLRSTVKLQYRFGADSRIIRDYAWLEKNLGPLVPLELVVHFDADSPGDFLDRLQQVSQIESRIRQIPEVGAALSALSFAPHVPSGRSFRDSSERTILRSKTDEITQALQQARFLADGEDGEQLWRISVRAPALSDIDYGRFVETLREAVEPVVQPLDTVHVTYTGVIPLIYKAQRELLNDLLESFFLAFGVIALVMVVVLRNVRAGLLAMVPNIFPAVVIFGLMGWCNIWIEIGSIMTASAAMGIAVDDTFHFLAWFRSAGRQGQSRHEALRFAFHRCAGAMFHTTLICSCGLLVFSLSSFMPIVRFAWMMAILLVAALAGDLLLLPALLAGRLGKLFLPRSSDE